MMDIDSKTDIWSRTKFKEIELDSEVVDPEYFGLVQESFVELGIAEKFMVGSSVEKLLKVPAAESMNGPKFSDAFHELNNKNLVSPGLYLALILNRFMDGGREQNLLSGYLARALRSFASFMREPDLAYKLKILLEVEDESVSVNMDPEQDVKKHVDIVVRYKGKIFNLWSYQATRRGLPHTIDRLSGNRGEVCDGLNILCPLRTEEAREYVNKKTSIEKKQKKLDDWFEERNEGPIPSRKKKLDEIIQSNQSNVIEMQDDLKKLYDSFSQEIIIKNGWFLHAPDYVETVKEFMDQCLQDEGNFMRYEDLQKIILRPENIVNNISIFKK